jgi:hypothetical protein
VLDGLAEHAPHREIVGDLGEQLLNVHFARVGGPPGGRNANAPPA